MTRRASVYVFDLRGEPPTSYWLELVIVADGAVFVALRTDGTVEPDAPMRFLQAHDRERWWPATTEIDVA